MTKSMLSATSRDFFRLVEAAAFANPFSSIRDDFDRMIAGIDLKAPVKADDLLKIVEERVSRELAIVRKKAADLGAYPREDEPLVRLAELFVVFHRYAAQLDELIELQGRAGEKPLPVRFAREVLHDLTNAGFDRERALRYFAIFYQLRRAYYFISREVMGNSPAMNRLRCEIWTNVFTLRSAWYDQYLFNRMEDFSTLLLGSTGVGKSSVAAAIGRSGFIPFKEKESAFAESFSVAFVAANLTQFPDALVESELFGHVRGAFTGALQERSGLFARCSRHGAVFLDEIGDIPLTLQAKLLTVLQDRQFMPVGGNSALRFDGRVIAATNRPLDELRAKGSFRDDFYYRLCSHVIRMPSLRERLDEAPEELEGLLAVILSRMIGDAPAEMISEVGGVLARDLPPDYHWPGNVRELEQATRRILLTGTYQGERRIGDLVGAEEARTAGLKVLAGQGLSSDELLSAYCSLLYEELGSYEEVARRTKLDRRTVKKYLTMVSR